MVMRPLGLLASALSRFAACPEYTGGPGKASRGTGARSQGVGKMALLAQPLIPVVPLGWVGLVGGCCWSILIESKFGVGWSPHSPRDDMRMASVPI